MKTYTITGGGGLQLHVVEDGNPCGPPLLFIHGWSQSYLAWVNQFNSSLTRNFRVVTMDNRGHGLSDKPRDVYGESKLWADDINSVITELTLDRPIVSVWSYGGMVICDYIRVHGETNLGGVNFVSALTKVGTESAKKVIGEEFFANAIRSMSENTEECIMGIEGYLWHKARISFRRATSLVKAQKGSTEPGIDESYLVFGYNVIVPPFVRAQLFARTLENDDVLRNITVPVLISHGDKDEVVLPLAGEQLAALIPRAKYSVYENGGHSLPSENPKRFNQELRRFALNT